VVVYGIVVRMGKVGENCNNDVLYFFVFFCIFFVFCLIFFDFLRFSSILFDLIVFRVVV